MKKILLLALCMMLIASMVACSAPQSTTEPSEESSSEIKEITIRVGHTTPPDSPYSKGVDYLADLLKEYSDGKITMQNFHSAQLGSDRDLIESVSLGTLEMAVVSTAPLASFSEDFLVFDLPYLITDREKAFEQMDGEIGQAIMDSLLPKGIKGVSFWENGFRQLSNSVREVKSPADLKGLKIRTMENKIHVATFEALGAYATPMPGGELFTALQQGVVDGQDNPLPGILTSKFYEVQKYVSLTGQFYSPGVLLINNAYYEKLPEATREIFDRACVEARDWQREYNAQVDREAIKQLEDLGMKVYTDINKEEWAALCKPVYEEFAGDINPEYIKAFTGN